jgi:hypothetical protein
MWLTSPSIRSSFAQASECSESALLLDCDTWASKAAASCSLSGKPTPQASWLRALKKAAWMQRLSGSAISETPHTHSFAAWWMESLRASHAKICLSPDAAPGSTATAPASSSTSSTPPTLAVRGSSLWRTSQASLLPPPPLWTKPKGLLKSEQPPESWENWPTAGGMRNGSLFQRPTWAPAMGGRGGSALHGDRWQTPKASEEESGSGLNGRGEPKLKAQAINWPTPMAGMGENSHGQISGDFRRNMDLILTENWPTPRSTDGTKGGPNQAGSKGDLMLPSAAAQWPTPAARDAKGSNSKEHCTVTGGGRKHMDQLSNFVAHSSHPALQTQPGQESSPPSPTSPRRLNPIFGSWLMGWPLTWVIAEPSSSSASATESFRRALDWQLSSLLGEPESSE